MRNRKLARLLSLFFWLSSWQTLALGQEEGLELPVGGGSWHWTPEAWTETVVYKDTQGYASRPAKQMLQRITVQWQEPELDKLGNICTIRGRLKLSEDAEKQTLQVNWSQGVSVYMSKTPGTKPDWSAGMNQEDTVGRTVVAKRTGEFELKIDLRETEQNRASSQPFQFGLSLAQHTVRRDNSQRVVWSSQTPAIPATVRMLRVPAAPELARELALINRASGWPFGNPNGVLLIRAVNGLQPLGKEQALAILEEYTRLDEWS